MAENRHVFRSFDEQGNVLASAKLEYLSTPERLFMVRWIGLENDVAKRQGVGGELLQKVNKFLEEKNMPGVLSSVHSTADFYRKNGWSQYKNTAIYFFGSMSDENKAITIQKIYFKLKVFGN